MEFYKNVRPWGFWKPILKKINLTDKTITPNTNFLNDILNIVIGMIWQISLVLIPIYLLVYKYSAFFSSLLIAIITTIFLKKNWYNKLGSEL